MKSACAYSSSARLRLLDAELAEALAPTRTGRSADHVHAEALRALRRRAGRCGRTRAGRASSRRARRRPTSSAPSCPRVSAACACGTLRASASSSAMVCSAAVITFDCGALATMIPRLVAASTSTLSTPTPARPITFRLVGAGDQVGGELASPSGSGSRRSRRSARPARRRSSPSPTSTSKRSRSSSTPGVGDLLRDEDRGRAPSRLTPQRGRRPRGTPAGPRRRRRRARPRGRAGRAPSRGPDSEVRMSKAPK